MALAASAEQPQEAGFPPEPAPMAGVSVIAGSLPAPSPEPARAIAEAQVELLRVKTARLLLFQELSKLLGQAPAEASSDLAASSAGNTLADDADEASNLDALFQQLARLNRYDHRAVSRRRSAIRMLDRDFRSDSPDPGLVADQRDFSASEAG
jgi:hypothetical protein